MMSKDMKEFLRAFNENGVKDLIRNKLEAGRDQDILDVKALRLATGEGPDPAS
jgi:hypothetical protein